MPSPTPAAIARSTAFALALLVVPVGTAAQQPRDPRTEVARPETQREVELKAATAAEPARLANWTELAKLQETRGAIEEAERTLKSAVAATAGTEANAGALTQQAGFYNRQGRFDQTIAALEAAAELNPGDPKGHQLVATYYWEKSFKDHALTPADKLKYIDAGIAATDRAIARKADYVEAMTYKNILLRMKAQLEPDPAQRDAMLAEADLWRAQAMRLNQAAGAQTAPTSGAAATSGAPAPPPPPGAPVRVGGNIAVPTKMQHVSPVYPPEAQDAKVSGLVIIEATINAEGNVSDARVLRSIPMLDQAALDAVKQWRFTPTLLNGAPVPVIMTVTVNFTLQ